MIEYDDEQWDEGKDDYWKGAASDVKRDADGHVVVSEQGRRLDARWYARGWALVVGLAVLVALVVVVVVLVAR